MTSPSSSSLTSALLELYRAMSPARRRQFYFVIGLMLFGAFAELVAIGSVVPFLSLLANPDAIHKMPPIAALFASVGANSRSEMVTAAAGAFCAAAVVAALIRLQLSWSSQNFVFLFGHEVGVEIHRRILLQPYSYHISHNTSELIAALDKTHTEDLPSLVICSAARITLVTAPSTTAASSRRSS